MQIIGAGLSGLLAARMLYNYKPHIIERQEELPNNHTALLRFRTDAVSKAINIPFKKVTVYKGVLNQHNEIVNYASLADINAYASKTVDMASERSIINLAPGERWIAPDSLISRLADIALITYNTDFADAIGGKSIPIISTIPMPTLMDKLGYPNTLGFSYKPIWTINCTILDCNVYQTLYIPYDMDMPYRASITGNKLTLEFTTECDDADDMITRILSMLYITANYINVETKFQSYGKIVPIDDNARKTFILWATDNFGIYSLGRFATWRRDILLDDILHDIEIIQGFIYQRNEYNRKKVYVT